MIAADLLPGHETRPTAISTAMRSEETRAPKTPAANQIDALVGEGRRRESDPEENQIHQTCAGGKNHIQA